MTTLDTLQPIGKFVPASVTTEPVTLAEAKTHVRVDTDADDALLTGLIMAGREVIESLTGRLLITRSCVYTCPPCGQVQLPGYPMGTLTSVAATLTTGGSPTTLSATAYSLDASDSYGILTISTIPNDTASLAITYSAGYASAAACPQALKQAVLLLVGHWYQSRETAQPGTMHELPYGVEALCRLYRVAWGFGGRQGSW
jgi:uncharacterized phiE125 gp8 family phage protein